SFDALDGDRVQLAKVPDPVSVLPIDQRPSVLLVSPADEGLAGVLMGEWHPDKHGKIPNPLKGMAKVVSSARLNGDPTRRWLFASPLENPAFCVAFLNGQDAPRVTQQASFRTDSIEYKVSLEYVAAPFSPTGAVVNSGVSEDD